MFLLGKTSLVLLDRFCCLYFLLENDIINSVCYVYIYIHIFKGFVDFFLWHFIVLAVEMRDWVFRYSHVNFSTFGTQRYNYFILKEIYSVSIDVAKFLEPSQLLSLRCQKPCHTFGLIFLVVSCDCVHKARLGLQKRRSNIHLLSCGPLSS